MRDVQSRGRPLLLASVAVSDCLCAEVDRLLRLIDRLLRLSGLDSRVPECACTASRWSLGSLAERAARFVGGMRGSYVKVVAHAPCARVCVPSDARVFAPRSTALVAPPVPSSRGTRRASRRASRPLERGKSKVSANRGRSRRRVGGSFRQVAQVLGSISPSPVRPAYVAALEGMTDAAPGGRPWRAVRRQVERELGGRRLESVFSEFDRVPIGTASIGQVHRAVLREDCDCLGLGLDDGAGGRVVRRRARAPSSCCTLRATAAVTPGGGGGGPEASPVKRAPHAHARAISRKVAVKLKRAPHARAPSLGRSRSSSSTATRARSSSPTSQTSTACYACSSPSSPTSCASTGGACAASSTTRPRCHME